MTDEPRGRIVDGGIQQVGPGDRPDRTTPEEATERGQKWNAQDPEWLSMATADPAHFLKGLGPE